MATNYDSNAEIQSVFDSLFEDETFNEFNGLRNKDIKFKVVCKSKFKGEDELVCGGAPAELKKIAPLHRLFIDADYILVVDDYEWRASDANRRKAMVHHALMTVRVEIADSGEVRLKPRAVDIAEYRATVARFGLFEEALESFADTFHQVANAAASEAISSLTVTTSAPAENDEEDEPAPTPKRSKKAAAKAPVEPEADEDETPAPPVKSKKKSTPAPADQDDEGETLDDSVLDDLPSSLTDTDDDEGDKEESTPRSRRSSRVIRDTDEDEEQAA